MKYARIFFIASNLNIPKHEQNIRSFEACIKLHGMIATIFMGASEFQVSILTVAP